MALGRELPLQPAGLTATIPYFDRTPYVEFDDEGTPTYVEHHRTIGDRAREIVAAGMELRDIVEPDWPEWLDREWGQWSPLRGQLFPGTQMVPDGRTNSIIVKADPDALREIRELIQKLDVPAKPDAPRGRGAPTGPGLPGGPGGFPGGPGE